VIIQAQVASTAITATTTLTVNGKALFITMGFGNTISNLDETTYSKAFTVYVTDANGVAVGNQLLSLSAIPEVYYKGFLSFNGENWVYSTGTTPAAVCANEDVNLNGILDSGEDTNGNGQLTPGNVVVTSPGSVTTDAFGRASFNLQYSEQYAPWAVFNVTARALVAGTESRQSIRYSLVGVVSDFSDKAVSPAGRLSPFGASSSCTNSN